MGVVGDEVEIRKRYHSNSNLMHDVVKDSSFKNSEFITLGVVTFGVALNA